MRIRALCSSILLFWLFAGCICEASAVVEGTTFEDMMKNSPTIAVVKLLDVPDRKNYTTALEISQVLKGTLKPGKHNVSFADFPTLGSQDREFVVFLDEKLIWRFVAAPLDSQQPVDKAVLAVKGFCDWSAHRVSPGLVTIAQLKAYIKDQSLVYRFRGPIYFPQLNKTEWKASSLFISGSYDVTNKKVTVEGLPQLEGFPAQPDVHVCGRRLGEGGKVNLTYNRDLSRELEIMGNVERLDGQNGELLVQFAVTNPEVLTENAFKEYLGDAHKGGFVATFKLPYVPKQEKAEERTLSLTLGKWTETDCDGMQLEGWDQDPIKILAMDYNGPDERSSQTNYVGASPFPKVVEQELARQDGILRLAAKTRSGDSVILAFDLNGPLQPQGPFKWTFQNELRLVLYTKQIRATILLSDGNTMATIATSTPAFDSLGFNRRDRK
jgi:hypothetical protein